MNPPRVLELPVNLIYEEDRLRPVDPAHVEQLIESIDRRGLDTPIVVREADADGRHKLLAGSHRLAAVRKLAWPTVPAFVRAADDAEARLIEIEENLVRHDLTELDRAIFLAQWKALYTELRGARPPGRPRKGQGANSPQYVLPFGKAVAERLRMHPRNVNKAVARAGIAAPLREALRGHKAADNGSALDLLARLLDAEQRRLASELQPNWSVGQVRKRAAELLGRAPAATASVFAQLVRLWARADGRERARFREHIGRRGGADT